MVRLLVKCPEKDPLTSVFVELSECPQNITSYHLDTLENYVKKLYYPTTDNSVSINTEIMQHFSRLANSNLRSIPFSRLGLIEHTKRTCFQAGWCWVECRENVILPYVKEWGHPKNTQNSLIPR